MAVSCVVTSLLLPGHEPFPAALPTLKDVEVANPSISKQMVTFPLLCWSYFLLLQDLLRIDHWNVKMASNAMRRVLLRETARVSSFLCLFSTVRNGADCHDRTDWQLNCVKCRNHEAFRNFTTMYMCQSTWHHMLGKFDVRLNVIRPKCIQCVLSHVFLTIDLFRSLSLPSSG